MDTSLFKEKIRTTEAAILVTQLNNHENVSFLKPSCQMYHHWNDGVRLLTLLLNRKRQTYDTNDFHRFFIRPDVTKVTIWQNRPWDNLVGNI